MSASNTTTTDRPRRQLAPAVIERMEREQKLAKLRRKAMRDFMERNQLTPYEWAAKADLPGPNAIYNFLNGRTNSLSNGTLERLARAVPGATVAMILGEAPVEPKRMRVRALPCRMEARAGRWVTNLDLPESQRLEIPIPDVPGLVADDVIRIGDEHIAFVYPAGSYCTVELLGRKRPLKLGDRVVVHRTRGDTSEITVREIVGRRGEKKGEEAAELHFRCGLPQLKPVAIGLPIWPYDGRSFEVDGDTYTIRGRITMCTMMEHLVAA